jgi:predicted Fe-Mo cluster-binding NifX family protein
MKVAITSKGADIDSPVDPRFGRAPYVIIFDSESNEFESLDNLENVNRLKGAGIHAATMISEKGAEVLMTGYCGPNAIKTLNAAKIKVVLEVVGTVKDAVASFTVGDFTFSDAANTEGHWV